MKKYMVLVLLVIGIVSLGFLLGCGQSNETTTTTTSTTTTTVVTITSTQVNAAKTGVLLASGGSSMGVSAATVGSSAGKSVALSVKSSQAGPPDSFFTVDLLNSADGYLQPTTEAVRGNMTPYLKLYSKSGQGIYGAFLSGKTIAKFITVEVQSIFSSSPGSPPPGITEEVSYYISRYLAAQDPFGDPTIFRQISTEADYLCWAFIFPSMEAGVNSHPGLPAHVYFTTPEANDDFKIGSMECKMVFSKAATGELSLFLPTAPGGKPISGTYGGSGELATPAGSMKVTLFMTFSADGPPTSVTFLGTTEATPKCTVIVYMNPATMSATGEVFDSSGTKIGTLEGSAAGGGKVYIGATSEAFSF